MPAKFKIDFRHHIGFCKHPVHVPDIQASGETEVITQFGVDQGRLWLQRTAHIRRTGQLLPFNLDIGQCILGLSARQRDHRDHRLTLPASPVDGQCVLWR